MSTFAYPGGHSARRHGPAGYSNYESYVPWLRDEFAFRCVFCLLRELSGRIQGMFDIAHFLPIALYPDQEQTNDNLLYCCTGCNAAKGKQIVEDPIQVLRAENVHVHENGAIEGRTPAARRLIRVLGLDAPEYREFRLLWLNITALAERHDPHLFRRLTGFPDDLPDLTRLRPPGGNTRPQGIHTSHFAQSQRGELVDTY